MTSIDLISGQSNEMLIFCSANQSIDLAAPAKLQLGYETEQLRIRQERAGQTEVPCQIVYENNPSNLGEGLCDVSDSKES